MRGRLRRRAIRGGFYWVGTKPGGIPVEHPTLFILRLI
jgi:hypothetical protein